MSKNILIVDDEPFVAYDLASLVEGALDAHITICHCAADAMREVEAHHFDIALLDIEVTDGNTFDVARELKRRGEAFAFISGFSPAATREIMGDVDFLEKPVCPEQLHALLAQRVGPSNAAYGG